MLRRLFAVVLTVVAIGAAGWLSLRRADIPFETLEAAYTAPSSQFLSLDSGYKTHYRIQGPDDAPAIVFVHGFSGSLHDWDPLIRALGNTHRLISVDLPGHGLTRGFDSDTISIDGYVDFLDEFVGRIGLERFSLVGYSMGGAAASGYALHHSEKVDRLVLINATDWPPAWMNRTDRALILSLATNSFAKLALKDLDVAQLLMGDAEVGFHDPDYASAEYVARRTALNRAPGHREALLSLAAPNQKRFVMDADSLSALSDRIMVVESGQADDQTSPSHGNIQNADYKRYEDTGRMAHIEAAGRLASDLEQFWTALDNGAVLTSEASGGPEEPSTN